MRLPHSGAGRCWNCCDVSVFVLSLKGSSFWIMFSSLQFAVLPR